MTNNTPIGELLMQGTFLSAITGNSDGGSNIMILVLLGAIYRLYLLLQSQEHNIYQLIPYWMQGSLVMNKLEYIGEVVSTHGFWNHSTTAITSDEFDALLAHLRDNCQKKARSFTQLTLHNIDSSSSEDQSKSSTLYVCNSRVPFRIAPEITCSVCLQSEEDEKSHMKTKKITISLMSSTKDAHGLMEFVEDMTTKYLEQCKIAKHHSLYIYRLRMRSGDDASAAYWHEVKFQSTRRFDNIYFRGKKEILDKLAFFRDNEAWYRANGLPWTLGIGLHGPPGTGKTSFLKALTNYFKRHVVELPLNLIQDEEQFFEAYFETGYGRKDKTELDWCDKIIALEDIDAQTEVVRRDTKPDKGWFPVQDKDGQMVLQPQPQAREPLSLACILNTIDGVRENHGRVIVLSSNHYHQLDPALTRAGRIDIEIRMGNADISVLDEIHTKHFGAGLDANWRAYFDQGFELAPCDIMNCLKGGVNCNEFLSEVAKQYAEKNKPVQRVSENIIPRKPSLGTPPACEPGPARAAKTWKRKAWCKP